MVESYSARHASVAGNMRTSGMIGGLGPESTVDYYRSIIVRVTCDYAKALGLKKVGLFGTGFTMRASFYPEEFRRAGIALVRPKEAELEFIHGKYIGELLNNQFLPETKTEILNIAQRMRSEDGIEALVLAGTELPLLLRDSANPGIEFLDTSIIHVEAIVDELLS
jgi:aspartate racemase